LDYGTKFGPQRFVFRSEGLFTQHQAYQFTPSTANPEGIITKNYYKIAGAIETSFGEAENLVSVLYQPIWTHTPGINLYDTLVPGAKSDNDILHVLDISHSVRKTDDKLGIDVTLYVDKGGNEYRVPGSVYGGWSSKYAGSWHFSDNVRGMLAYTNYQGSKNDIVWGAYHKYTNVSFDLKYEW
jgi:hypothetical protein